MKLTLRACLLSESQEFLSQQPWNEEEILGFTCPEHGVVLRPAPGKHGGKYLQCPEGGYKHFNVRSTPPHTTNGELLLYMDVPKRLEPEVVSNPKFNREKFQKQLATKNQLQAYSDWLSEKIVNLGGDIKPLLNGEKLSQFSNYASQKWKIKRSPIEIAKNIEQLLQYLNRNELEAH